jgi:hypothetical protein
MAGAHGHAGDTPPTRAYLNEPAIGRHIRNGVKIDQPHAHGIPSSMVRPVHLILRSSCSALSPEIGRVTSVNAACGRRDGYATDGRRRVVDVGEGVMEPLVVTRLRQNPLGAVAAPGLRGDLVRVSDGSTTVYLLPSEYEGCDEPRLRWLLAQEATARSSG